jgi:hypothetical protein
MSEPPHPPEFRGSQNMAMKIPAAEFDATLAFYRDVLRLPLLEAYRPRTVFRFGSHLLWLDRVEHLARVEIWLEILASDTAAAKQHFAAHSIEQCGEVEKLPASFDGFFVRSPASLVHLVYVAPR